MLTYLHTIISETCYSRAKVVIDRCRNIRSDRCKDCQNCHADLKAIISIIEFRVVEETADERLYFARILNKTS